VERGVGKVEGQKGGHPGHDRPDGGVRFRRNFPPLLFLHVYLSCILCV
jgi:hypothetical protein